MTDNIGTIVENHDRITTTRTFDHLVNPSNAYEIRKQDLVRYIQAELSNNLHFIIANHEEAEKLAERVEKRYEYGWKRNRYYTNKKEEILERNEARMESRRKRRRRASEETCTETTTGGFKTSHDLDALNGVVAVGDWDNVTSEQKEGREDVVEEDIDSELRKDDFNTRTSNIKDVKESNGNHSSLLNLLEDDDINRYATFSGTSEIINSTKTSGGGLMQHGEEDDSINFNSDRRSNKKTPGEEVPSLLDLLGDDDAIDGYETFGKTSESSTEAALDGIDRLNTIADNMNASSHTMEHTEKNKTVEKNRLLALFQNMNEAKDDNNVDRLSTETSAKSEVSLMELLDDDLYGPDLNDNSRQTGGKSYPRDGTSSTGTKRKSLLQVLDDDFDEIFGPDTKTDISPPLSDKVSTDNAGGSLLDLLSDGGGKRNPVKPSLTSTSLVDLLGEDGMSGTRENDSDRHQSFLINVLDGNDSTALGRSSGGMVEGKPMPNESKDTLLDLLDDENLFDASPSESGSSKTQNFDEPNPRQNSLLALLDNDESTNLQSGIKLGVEEEGSSKLPAEKDSLLDLLSDNGETGSTKEENNHNSSGDSLLGVLDVSGTKTNQSNIGNTENSGGNSLLSLLNEESPEFDGEQDTFKGDYNANAGGASLLSLLDGDEFGMSQSNVSGKNIESSDGGSLLSLLDKEAPESQDNRENDSFESELSLTLEELLIKVQSLISSLKRDDWKLLDQIGAISGDAYAKLDEDISGEKLVEIQDDQFVDELLMGSSMGKWNLTLDEFNMLLMHVATSKSPRKIEIILDLYLHMKELNKSTRGVSILDPEIYTVLLGLLDKIPGAGVIADDICGELIDYMENDLNHSDGEKGRGIFEIGEETIEAAMKIQTRTMDVRKAEVLMDWSLSEFGRGVRVSPMVFKMMLMLYKSSNNQEKALELIETCIKENEDNPRGVDFFLKSAVNWPRKNRQGRKIAVGSYCEAMVDILGGLDRSYSPSFSVWRKMLNFALYTANESPGKWELVQRCCHALVSHNEMSEEVMDDRLLQVGLEVADRMRDPLIATEIICKTSTNSYDHLNFNDLPVDDVFNWHPVKDEFGASAQTKISPSSYVKAIKLCIECGQPSLADKILAHSCRAELPKTILSDIHSLVLAGFTRNGDSEKASHIFHQMKMTGLNLSESTYASYMHGLVAGGKHEEALAVLDSMLDGSNEDGVKPGISSFTACMVSAIQSGVFNDVLLLNEKMKGAGVKPSATIFQGIIIANARLGDKEGMINAMETVIDTKTPVDASSFLLCAKHLMPEILEEAKMDISAIRLALRKRVENNPKVAKQAMELNRTLTDCLREDQRKPSKMKNEVMIQQLRDNFWRKALQDTIRLSKVL